MLIVAVPLAGVGSWLAVLSLNDAAAQARRNAHFQANLAATALSDALSQAKPELQAAAQGFPVAAIAAHPSLCRLDALHLGIVREGHLDLVLPDGQVRWSTSALVVARPSTWTNSSRSADIPIGCVVPNLMRS